MHGIENCNTNSVAAVDNDASNYGWTLTRVTNPVREGAKAVKFEIREGQPLVGSLKRVRSEVTVIKPQEDDWWPGRDIWYAFSALFPTVGMEDDPNSHESITQWYEDGDEDCVLKVRNGRLYFACIQPNSLTELLYDMFGAANAAPTTSTSTVANSFTAIPRDQWHNFVFHFIHSQNGDGLVEIWRDGVKIQTINGRNMHSAVLPKCKIGLYKSDYTEHIGRSIRPKRVVYFDNIRILKA